MQQFNTLQVSNFQHHNFFKSFFFFLVTVVLLHSSQAQLRPVQKVAFYRWKILPKSWTRYNPANLTTKWSFFIRIPGNVSPPFRFSLLSASFSYTFSGPPLSKSVLSIGIIESPNCTRATRLSVYTVNQVKSPIIDPARLGPCLTPRFVNISFTVPASGLITLKSFKAQSRKPPIISNFILYSSSKSIPTVSVKPLPSSAKTSITPTPLNSPSATLSQVPSPTSNPSAKSTPSPSSSLSPTDIYIVVDASKAQPSANITSYYYDGPFDRSQGSGVPSLAYRTGIQGPRIFYSYTLPAGSYDITFGFMETFPQNCFPEARVFDILINGFMRSESFDIFNSAGGCYRAYRERFVEQVVDGVHNQQLTIEMVAVSGLATVSYFRIEPSSKQCRPEGSVDNAKPSEDHFAHSVPGTYPSSGVPYYVDTSGNGFVRVTLDGGNSHTHYSDPQNNIKGRLRLYRWTNSKTGKLLSRSQVFTYAFPLGTTTVKLTVIDNACSKDEAETSITVIKSVVQGVYCYYYGGLSEHPAGASLFTGPAPAFAKPSRFPQFRFPNLPFPRKGLTARCIFYYKFDSDSAESEISVITLKSGIAYVYSGPDLVLDTSTTFRRNLYNIPKGLKPFEVIYRHTDFTKTPSMAFRVNGSIATSVFYDRSRIRPILLSIFPTSTGIESGVQVEITGIGLSSDLNVFFGNKSVSVLEGTSSSIFVMPPMVDSPGIVDVWVQNIRGERSAPLQFSYDGACDPVKFEAKTLVNSDGNPYKQSSFSAASLWQDGKLYTGAIDGVVRVIDYDPETLQIRSVCYSEAVTDSRYLNVGRTGPAVRFILGMTFDPRLSVPKPYLSTSTPFWGRGKLADSRTPRLWMNGAIVRMKPASPSTLAADPKQCLEFDQTIVSNIPVANSDHAIHELLFTHDGELLLSVGSSTNAGLPSGKMGGEWDNFLSGAVIVAHLNRPNFNGTIVYSTPNNLRTARPMTDNVELYATGLRNMFAMTMTRQGRIYGLDMGPNCGFGDAATSCDEYNETEWAKSGPLPWKATFPGKGAMGTPGPCYKSADRPDKVLLIQAGKFYGHPNLPRGQALGQPGECKYIDPLTDRTVKPFREAPPKNYRRPEGIIASPATGIREYGANHFCGDMRGDLVTSMLNGRITFRIPVKADGSAETAPKVLAKGTGNIKVDEDALGNLIYIPHLSGRNVEILKPIISKRRGLRVFNAVPFFHGKNGGTVVMIGGSGFSTDVQVLIGTNNCPIVRLISEQLLSCKVPAHTGGNRNVAIRVSLNGNSASLPRAILYTSV